MKSQLLHVRWPREGLALIDEAARRLGLTRSAYIRRAVLEHATRVLLRKGGKP